MRKSVENISLLQKQINDLQLENQILKNILERSGISYTHEISRISEPENTEEYEPDQGARIIHPGQITDEMANLFYARFWGRQDVYAKRSEKKSTGEAGYYTQCHNRWENICPKMRHEKMNCKDCPYQVYKQLTIKDIRAHLQGRSYNGSDVIGVYPLLKNGTCRFLVFDFDNHEKGAEKKDFANTNEAWIEKIKEADIPFEISDERQCGRHINVTFAGELRQEQKPALEEMMKYDNGILQAATAFGKTVVCSAMIAEKKVNTLIILESSALLEQWKDALEKFLDIDEKLPEYKTKTGRIRVRKSLIGKLQGAHDSMTGIVDIAMAGSLCKKGEWHPLLDQYGMVIVDECHHAASDTIAEVLQKVTAKYVYGVTATPKRSDGLEKINYMLLGPIRYSYSAKEKVKAQGIPHLVYPRFTRTVLPRGVTAEKMHPNEAYEMLRHNEARDEQILSDVKNCIAAGRTPVILSKYKDHSERLYDQMKGYADKVFLMTGNNSKKEHKQIREQLQQTAPEETLALVATGSLIGEGFDFPRLDTLIMATPVSFRSVVEQYAGRLNRNYAGKKDVIVFDYVDSHIPMFERMYGKRLKAYRQIGYEICSGLDYEKQEANAIFDGENYGEVFERDLLEAEHRIVISSNVISAKKVYEIINVLKEKQALGVEVTIVTWAPDDYGFGDAAFWMQLHEDMRQAGFFIKTVEDSCENFAVIDQEIIWYGNIHLLGQEKVEDNIMRVKDKKIAAELLELAFK